ncbi:MAG: phosphoglucosamine mutase [Rhodospirillaceae bacterium]|nr:phosphoglucosamine mutase [Rhodospirillaceae bacterium]OUT78279.1 MAG: phosphoglucosamine mutase [Rhodospirillaceae bacterium TMED23]
MTKIFGTDGIRGKVNVEPMTIETVLKVGVAAGIHFRRGSHRHKVVIGKDTRLSGYMFESALTAGFVAAGIDPILVGPMPTPAIAMLTRSLRCDLGVMISASHNPYEDNGIKLFGPDGYKLSDQVESEITGILKSDFREKLAPPADLGKAIRLDDVQGRYIEFVKQTVTRGLSLEGLKIVLDCANGAAYRVAPAVFWELGAEVVSIGIHPDGYNINKECGSTNIEVLKSQVLIHDADVGIALDGDADRLLMVDEEGALIDGDQILGMIAKYWLKENKVRGDCVVATVMSNLALENFLNEIGLSLLRTNVGDRYVVEEMRERGLNLGGEQSGHIILSDYITTGDGIIAALQILSIIKNLNEKASDICHVFDPLPQLLKSLKVRNLKDWNSKKLQKVISEGELKLGEKGRILVRPSGTEPVVRIMVEGEDLEMINGILINIANEIK